MNSNFLIIDNILPLSGGRDTTHLASSTQGVKKTFSVPVVDESTQGINACDNISDGREKQTEKKSTEGKSVILSVVNKGKTEQPKTDEDATLVTANQDYETVDATGATKSTTDGIAVLGNLSEAPLLQDDRSSARPSVESPDDSQQLVSTIVTSATVPVVGMQTLLPQGVSSDVAVPDGDESEIAGFALQQLESVNLPSRTDTINPDLDTIPQLVEQGISSSARPIGQMNNLLAEGDGVSADKNLIDSQYNIQTGGGQGTSDANFQTDLTQGSDNGIQNSLVELLQSSSLVGEKTVGQNGELQDKIQNVAAAGIKDIRATQSAINKESGSNTQFQLQNSFLEQLTSTVKDAGAGSQPRQDLTGGFASDVGRQIFDSVQSYLTGQGISNNIIVRLNPPELGRVVIKFQGRETQMTGLLEVSNAQTRTAVEQALPQLVRNLADSGIEIKRLEVVLSNNTQSDSQAQKENLFSGEQQHNWYDDEYTSSIVNVADGENNQKFSISPAENSSMNNSSLTGDYLNILL